MFSLAGTQTASGQPNSTSRWSDKSSPLDLLVLELILTWCLCAIILDKIQMPKICISCEWTSYQNRLPQSVVTQTASVSCSKECTIWLTKLIIHQCYWKCKCFSRFEQKMCLKKEKRILSGLKAMLIYCPRVAEVVGGSCLWGGIPSPAGTRKVALCAVCFQSSCIPAMLTFVTIKHNYP